MGKVWLPSCRCGQGAYDGEMPRRALADKRPFLLLSLMAAFAFYYLRAGDMPELYVIPIRGAACVFLMIYCLVRHSSADARLLAWALAAYALGNMAMEIDLQVGAMLLFLGHCFAIGVYLRHKRAALTGTQSWVCGLTLIFTPLIAWLLTRQTDFSWQAALYGLALGGMASSAWASTFPRYRVGAGAMLLVVSDILILAGAGPLAGAFVPEYLVWPIHYLGLFMICTGAIQTLRKRDPELRMVTGRAD